MSKTLELPTKIEIVEELRSRGMPDWIVAGLAPGLAKDPKEPLSSETIADHVTEVIRKLDEKTPQEQRAVLLHHTTSVHRAMQRLAKDAPKHAAPKREKAEKPDAEVEDDGRAGEPVIDTPMLDVPPLEDKG